LKHRSRFGIQTGRQKLFVSESLDLAGIYFPGAIVPIEALFDCIGPSRSPIVVR
jgi:hypothetical protein